MGLMSKKRAQPRIVKKRKRMDKKREKKIAPPEIADREIWQQGKTVNQNFEEMGIVLNTKPSMRQSTEGKALLTEARIRLNKERYEKNGIIDLDKEQLQELEEKK